MKVSELAGKVSELKTEMDGTFAAVDKRFEHVDQGLEGLRQQTEALSQGMSSEFERIRQRIRLEGETTRRHFDVVAEKILSERNLALDRSMATAQQLVELTASNAGDRVRLDRRLDDHERRLEKLEPPRDTHQ